MFGQGSRRVGGDVLHGGWIGGIGGDDNRVLHRAVLAEHLHHAGHFSCALPDRAIDTDDPGVLLVDDRIHRDRRFSGTTVSDDQLALTAAYRDHRIDRLDAGLERLLHRLALDDARRDHIYLTGALGSDGTESVDGLTESIHDPAQIAVAHRDLEHPTRAAHLVTLVEVGPVAHDDGPDVVLFEVQCERGDTHPGLG